MSAPWANQIYKGTVQNLVNGNTVLPRLLADIDAAEDTIHMSMFLFFNDPIGIEVADHLIARASHPTKPVAVRLMMNVGKTHFGDPISTGEVKMIKNDPSFRGDAI